MASPSAAEAVPRSAPQGGAVSVLPPGAEPLDADQLIAHDIFSDIQKDTVKKFIERHGDQPPIWRRRFKAGEIICREGDYGSTAFYIVKGKVEIYLASHLAHAKSLKGKADGAGKKRFSLIRKFKTLLRSAKEDAREEEQPRRFIPIDAPVHLAYDRPTAELRAGDIFGEMTCMSFYPRSATVRASEDVECLEMLRSVLLELLQRRSKRFKDQLDTAYRKRALDAHLRSVPIFADLTQEFIDHLRGRVELISCEPGEPIFKQGDPADSFYLIRLGFVRVSQQHPGGELVLAYLGRGQYFGEIGCLANVPRTATCGALDHVELVRIKREDFDLMVAKFPQIRKQLEDEAGKRLVSSRLTAKKAPTVPLEDFLTQGLMNAKNVLLIDLDRCTRCDECVRACADAHDGITRLVRDGLRFDKYLVATSCRACTDPLCMIGCPVGSIRRRESLEILIEDWCIGCSKCANQCPYGNINMQPFEVMKEDPDHPGQKKAVFEKKALTCDLCSGLDEPSCVYACPHDAAIRVEPIQFFAEQLSMRAMGK